ncbi:MAG: RraA family protein [Propionibacteriaceae bacterium]|jgi:regulator of RNase E activity RraA|nr:RraA family protein [Propionibacteriaceae bacterium]
MSKGARLTSEQLEELREFDSPTVWNALEGFGLSSNTTGFSYPGLELRTPSARPMVGYAATAKVAGWTKAEPEQKDLMFAFFEAIRAIDGPAVAVVQDTDARPIGSFWGEVQATTCQALGAVGTLTQGGVRDLNEVGPLGFYLFSTELMVARADSHVTEVGSPVTVSGLVIAPGDLIHADVHGAVVIPAEAAPDLAAACRRVTEAELSVLEPARAAIAAGVRPQVAEIRAWRAELAQRRPVRPT